MLKKTITFTDFNGEEQKEDFYFNISRAEAIEWDSEHKGGMKAVLERLIAEKDGKAIYAIFKDLIRRSIGKKSDDGRRFIKTEEIINDFMETDAYSVLLLELSQDANAAAAFVKGITPPAPQDHQKPAS